jgi:uncharacterized protein YodC (DUF2158 family)
MQPLVPWQHRDSERSKTHLASFESSGRGTVFKIGDVVRLKCGGARMIVSKLFKSREGCEMVQCTWFDKRPREHRAAFVIDSLEAAEQAAVRTRGEGLTD